MTTNEKPTTAPKSKFHGWRYRDPDHMPYEPSTYVTYEWRHHPGIWQIKLTAKGRKLLRTIYPDHKDVDVMAQLGVPISRTAFKRIVRSLKLHKSAAHMAAMRDIAQRRAKVISLAFGLYEEKSRRMKGHVIGDGSTCFKPGETNATRYGAERAKAIHQKIGLTRRAIFRRERLRILSGEPQQTHLLIGLKRPASCARHRLLRVNHYLPADPEAYAPTSFTWDEHTRRRPLLEERYAHRHDFRFIPPQDIRHDEAEADDDDDDSLITIQEMDDDLE